MLIDEAYTEVDAWVSEILRSRHAPKIRDFKVCRDPIHDFIRLYPHEVAIMDSPIVQRLRRIRQNALSYFVYPGMHHTRFEHSLGVVHVAELVLSALENHHKEEITPRRKILVRLAALLHDIGHVFLSHLGETLLEETHGEFFEKLAREIVDGTPELFRDLDISEILSYLIVTSNPFKQYFQEALTGNPPKELTSATIEPVEVARLIIGRVKNEEEQFMADIIHGSIDADKLDYFMRDCHYSGIRAEVDASRLINMMAILDSPGWPRNLTVTGTALHHLEQILITKLILYTSIYHHHKIRASEAVVRLMFRKLQAQANQLKHEPLKFAAFTDFLRIDDARFFVWASQEDGLEELVEQATGRELLKRSVVLCRQSVHPSTQHQFMRFFLPAKTPTREVQAIEQEIYDAISPSNKVDRRYLVLDFPPFPDADEEAAHAFVQTSTKAVPEVLKDLLPTADWLRSYAVNKYRAHVFYVDDEGKRLAAADAAESVLQQKNIRLNSLARDFAHLG